MTSLPVEAASFNSRSFSACFGCEKDRSIPGNVAGGMFVSLVAAPAGSPDGQRLGDTVLFGGVPAGLTALGNRNL